MNIVQPYAKLMGIDDQVDGIALSSCGPLVVRWRNATKAQAEFLVKGIAFGKPVPGAAIEV